MRPPDQARIVLVGAGNLGLHLGKTLHEKGLQITQIFSRNLQKAKTLSSLIESEFVTDLSAIAPDADWYILAVADDALEEVSAQLGRQVRGNPLVVHTSGATPSTVLQPYFDRYGIFYPLNTFRRETTLDMSHTPICVFANREEDSAWLLDQAARISDFVRVVDDEQRAVLHVAAVFANNFTNHLFSLSEKILEEENLPFDFLRPIILEAARRLQDHSPARLQTGPAVRGDQKTLERHIAYLRKYHPGMVALYKQLTDAIQDKDQ